MFEQKMPYFSMALKTFPFLSQYLHDSTKPLQESNGKNFVKGSIRCVLFFVENHTNLQIKKRHKKNDITNIWKDLGESQKYDVTVLPISRLRSS